MGVRVRVRVGAWVCVCVGGCGWLRLRICADDIVKGVSEVETVWAGTVGLEIEAKLWRQEGRVAMRVHIRGGVWSFVCWPCRATDGGEGRGQASAARTSGRAPLERAVKPTMSS